MDWRILLFSLFSERCIWAPAKYPVKNFIAKIVNNFKSIIVLAKSSVSDVWQVPTCAYVCDNRILLWYSKNHLWYHKKRKNKTLRYFNKSLLRRWCYGLRRIIYKKTDEWYNEWQWVTKSGTTSDNEWQRVTTNDNEWQSVINQVTANDQEWHRVTMNDTEW